MKFLEDGQRARVPTRADDRGRVLSDGNLVDPGLVPLEDVSIQRSALHDRLAMLKQRGKGALSVEMMLPDWSH